MPQQGTYTGHMTLGMPSRPMSTASQQLGKPMLTTPWWIMELMEEYAAVMYM